MFLKTFAITFLGLYLGPGIKLFSFDESLARYLCLAIIEYSASVKEKDFKYVLLFIKNS